MVTNWEPYPDPLCDHIWAPAGHSYQVWSSSGTNDEPPPDAPVYKKEMCLKCGGIQDNPQ